MNTTAAYCGGDYSRKALQRALDKRSRQHLYSYEKGKIVVREPDTAGGARVCTLDGDPSHAATIKQAAVICEALDKLARKAGVL